MAVHLRLLLSAAASLLLAGCGTTVVGAANVGRHQPVDVPPEAFPITGAAPGNPVDQGMRNALTDLYTFWGHAYPDTFGGDFVPLQGGVFSVDPDHIDPAAYPDGVGCGLAPQEAANNAFFCAAPGKPHSDSITYDRKFLGELADQSGPALVPVVMAHEFGHAIQFRFGYSGPSINQETQADCFAGAWAAWVVAGHAQHVAMRKADLDQIIRGYLKVADPVGVDPRQQGAHGSYFDRVSALAEGYENGTTACRDDFGPERVFTELGGATDPASLNAPYDTTLQIVDNTLPPFWKQVFSTAFGKDFHEPAITPFSGTAPRCASGNRDLVYCHSDHTVYYDETDLVRPAYEQVGDFAVNTAISLPYALAVRDQLGRSTKGAAATRSAVCLTGWYEAQIFNGAFQSANVQISPGDVDEAVVFLLDYGVRNSVFPDTNASGFQLLLSYRAGFLQGGAPCDVGISD